ncbi:MAG TPA: radical SAM protein [Myxococcota bacterium]|nr:radical SAM protein [Myxococcota bacterium]HRY93026.1 radical SAM protein [Myxococcota bacterium]
MQPAPLLWHAGRVCATAGSPDALAAAAEVSLRVERPGARRVTRVAAAGACGDALTVHLAGCNLACAHCWAGPEREEPARAGFLTHLELARKLRLLRAENRLGASPDALRLSGGEPLLSELSLALVADLLARLPGRLFVETNGIALGAHPAWARALTAHGPRLFLKLSLKAATPAAFARITGRDGAAVELPFRAAAALLQAGVPFDLEALSLEPRLFPPGEREALHARLRAIDGALPGRLREETLTPYPDTSRRMAALT